MQNIKFRADYQYDVTVDEMQLYVRQSNDFDPIKSSQLWAPVTFQGPFDKAKHERAKPFISSANGAREFMQTILDLAWTHGMRPTGVETSEAKINAMAKHLADMRALVSGSLKIQLPGDST